MQSNSRVVSTHCRRFTGLVFATLVAGSVSGCAVVSGLTTASVPQELDCPRSIEAVDGSTKRMAALVARIKSESQAMPSTMAAILGRVAGKPGDGLQSHSDYERERLRAETILRRAKSNGCNLADAERQFEAAKAKMAELRGQ